MKNQRNKEDKGITLVALVVTIVILLILAGVAITELTQTGLFENAKQAKKITDTQYKKENTILEEYSNKINDIVEGTREENNSIKILSKVEATDDIKIYNYKYYYLI